MREVLSKDSAVKDLIRRLDEALSVIQDPWKDAVQNNKRVKNLYDTVKVPTLKN